MLTWHDFPHGCFWNSTWFNQMPGSLVIGLSAVSITLMFCYYYESPALRLPNHNTPIAVDTWFNSVRRAGQDFTRFSQNVSLLLFSLVAPIIHCILPNKHSLLVFQIVSWNVKFQYILFGFILVPIFLIIMLLIFLLCHRVILGHAIFDPPLLRTLTYILTFLDFLEK